MRRIQQLFVILIIFLIAGCNWNVTPVTPSSPTIQPTDIEISNRTPTGFYWPTGEEVTKNNWLADNCDWSDNDDYFKDDYHIGTDISAKVGQYVYTISSGIIIYISSGTGSGWDWDPNSGTNAGIFVEHTLSDGNKFLALYGHVVPNKEYATYNPQDREYTVNKDSNGNPILIGAGVPFAQIGSYGNDPHLHFGILPGVVYPESNWGRMDCPEEEPLDGFDTNGFEDPIEWITTKYPGQYLTPVTNTPLSPPTLTPPVPIPVPTPTRRPSTTVTSIPSSGYGSISGRTCAWMGGAPEMTIYASAVNSSMTYAVKSIGNQVSYGYFSMNLPSGDYRIFSLYNEDVIVGYYSCFAEFYGIEQINPEKDPVCDETQKSDHKPIVLTVKPGDEVTDVYLCDGSYMGKSFPQIGLGKLKPIFFATEESTTCENDSAFVTDITIPDDTEINEGQNFTKTWRLRNSGTCDWTLDYQLIFISGDQMSEPSQIIIGKTVRPGETTDISIELIAPSAPGTYIGTWQLGTSDGNLFGTNTYVQIVVP